MTWRQWKWRSEIRCGGLFHLHRIISLCASFGKRIHNYCFFLLGKDNDLSLLKAFVEKQSSYSAVALLWPDFPPVQCFSSIDFTAAMFSHSGWGSALGSLTFWSKIFPECKVLSWCVTEGQQWILTAMNPVGSGSGFSACLFWWHADWSISWNLLVDREGEGWGGNVCPWCLFSLCCTIRSFLLSAGMEGGMDGAQVQVPAAPLDGSRVFWVGAAPCPCAGGEGSLLLPCPPWCCGTQDAPAPLSWAGCACITWNCRTEISSLNRHFGPDI